MDRLAKLLLLIVSLSSTVSIWAAKRLNDFLDLYTFVQPYGTFGVLHSSCHSWQIPQVSARFSRCLSVPCWASNSVENTRMQEIRAGARFKRILNVSILWHATDEVLEQLTRVLDNSESKWKKKKLIIGFGCVLDVQSYIVFQGSYDSNHCRLLLTLYLKPSLQQALARLKCLFR